MANQIDWGQEISKIAKQQESPKSETPKEQKRMEWAEVLPQALKNSPTSTVRFLGDIWQSVRHPVETGKGIMNFMVGTAQTVFIPGKQEKEKYLDHFVEQMESRYGDVEKFKRTLANDPVGILSDVSSIITGIGTPLRVTKTGKAIAKAGSQFDPVTLAKNVVVGGGGKAVPKPLPRKMYISALKASTALPAKSRKRIVESALSNRITPSITGLHNLRKYIDSFGSKVDAFVKTAEEKGHFVPLEKLLAPLDDLKKEVDLSGLPMTAKRRIDKIKLEQIENAKKTNRFILTPTQAHKLKKRIYAELKTEYSKTRVSPPSADAQKKIAESAMKTLEEIAPEIKKINKEELGPMLELKGEIERAAARIQQRDLFGLSTPMKFTAGAVVGDVPGAIVALSLALLDTPSVKASTGILLEALRQRGVKSTPTATAIRMGLYQSGRYNNYLEDQGATQ